MSTTLVPSKPVLQPSNSQPQSGQHTDAHQTDQRSGQENPWHPRRDASGKLFYPLTDTNKFVFDLETEQEEGQKRDVRRYLRQVQFIGPLIEQTKQVDELPDPDETCSIGPSQSGSQITPSPYHYQYQYTTIEDEEASDYVDYTRSTMSKISSVSAGNGTASIYANVLLACDVLEMSGREFRRLDNPFTPEGLLNEVPSISANYKTIQDRVDAFIEVYEPKHTLGEDDICLVVRLVTAAALVDDYANKEKKLEPFNTQHQRLSRTGVWNVGPSHTTTLAKQPGSPFAKISAPDPDLAITLPGKDHATSLKAAIAQVYSEADIPADALDMLSDAICQELLDYEEIKDVVFVCRTDARETPLGNFMIVPFENKATPAGAAVALNQILNCLYFLIVKLYDMQKLALALYTRLEKNDNVPIGMSRPAFDPVDPEIKLYGIRVCGTSWYIDGLTLDLTEKFSAVWHGRAQGTLNDEAGRKNFMAAIKIAYRCNLTQIIPTIIEAHRFFLLYANHAKLLRRRSTKIIERLHKPKPLTSRDGSQPSSIRQPLAQVPALAALLEAEDTKGTLAEAELVELLHKAKIAQQD